MALAGQIVANLVANTDRWNGPMSGAVSMINRAATAVSAFAAVGAQRLASVGDQLDKTAARTGVNVRSLSQLKFAAEQTGSGLETLEKGFFGLSRSVYDAQRGSVEAVDAFDRLGLSTDQLSMLSAEQQLLAVGDALSKVEDSTIRGALAQKLLGRSGRQLLPMFAAGADGLAKLRQEADDLGITLTETETQLGARLTDAMNRGKRATEALSIRFAATFVPALEKSANLVAAIAAGSGEWVGFTVKLGVALIAAAVAIKAVTVATQAYTRAQAIALAFTGKAGWVKLAAGAAAAAVALGTVNYLLSDSTEGLKQTTAATDAATAAIDKQATAVDNLQTSVAGVPAAHKRLASSTLLIEKAEQRLANAIQRRGDVARLNDPQRLAAAAFNAGRKLATSYDELEARAADAAETSQWNVDNARKLLDWQKKLASNTATLADAFDKQQTSAQKLGAALQALRKRRDLLEHRPLGAKDDRAFTSIELNELRDRLIDSATGFGDHIQGIRDDIALLRGDATQTSLAIRDMVEAGVPSDKIAELRAAYDQLNQLKADKEAADKQAAEAERQKREKDAKLAALTTRADDIRSQIQTPLDEFRSHIRNAEELVTAGSLTRDEADAFIETKAAELSPEAAAQIAAAINGPGKAKQKPQTALERFSQRSGIVDPKLNRLEDLAARFRADIDAGKTTEREANRRLTNEARRLKIDSPREVAKREAATVDAGKLGQQLLTRFGLLRPDSAGPADAIAQRVQAKLDQFANLNGPSTGPTEDERGSVLVENLQRGSEASLRAIFAAQQGGNKTPEKQLSEAKKQTGLLEQLVSREPLVIETAEEIG